MLNSVSLLGRMSADPELKHTPSGVPVCTFTVAVTRSYAKQGEERQTDWLDIIAWRSTAEFICRYFRKGQMIAIKGTLQSRSFEDKEGRKRKLVEVNADEVSFGGDKKKEEKAEETAFDAYAPIDDFEELPFP